MSSLNIQIQSQTMLHSLQKGKQNFTLIIDICKDVLDVCSSQVIDLSGLRVDNLTFLGGGIILKKKILQAYLYQKKFMHWWLLQEKIHTCTFSDWKIASYELIVVVHGRGKKQIIPAPNHPTPCQSSNGPPLSRC